MLNFLYKEAYHIFLDKKQEKNSLKNGIVLVNHIFMVVYEKLAILEHSRKVEVKAWNLLSKKRTCCEETLIIASLSLN